MLIDLEPEDKVREDPLGRRLGVGGVPGVGAGEGAVPDAPVSIDVD